MPTVKNFNKEAIRADYQSGMKSEEIAKKHNCHKSTVYQICKDLVGSANKKEIDWNAVQARRNAGEKATDIMKDIGVSTATFYTKTHPAGGKQPVIRSRKFTKPTPSPFKNLASPLPAATNGHQKGSHRDLVEEIYTHLRATVHEAKKERDDLISQVAKMDKIIARLEKAVQ